MQISDVFQNALRRPSEYFHNHPTFFRVTQIACAVLGCGGALASRSSRFYEDDPRFLITIGMIGTFSGALIPFLIRAAGSAPDSEEEPSSTVAEPASAHSSPIESLASSDFENLEGTPPVVQPHPTRRFFFVSGFPFVRYGHPPRQRHD